MGMIGWERGAAWVRSRTGFRGSALFFALAAQAALLLGTAFVVVMQPLRREQPEFVAVKTVYLPQKQLEHQAALAEFQQAAGPPPLLDRIAVEALLPEKLPELPLVARADEGMFPSDAAWIDGAENLFSQGGLSAHFGEGGTGSSAAFFGVEDRGERIVVVVNTSASVVRKARNRGVSIERIQQEILQLVAGLDPGALFGVVQFSQGARSFADFLAPATAGNREALAAWIPANLRGNPEAPEGATLLGHEAAFELALRLEPDVVFLVTDGQLNRRRGKPGAYTYPEVPYAEFLSKLRSFLRGSGNSARIHVIGFEMETADAANMARLAREFGGQVREM